MFTLHFLFENTINFLPTINLYKLQTIVPDVVVPLHSSPDYKINSTAGNIYIYMYILDHVIASAGVLLSHSWCQPWTLIEPIPNMKAVLAAIFPKILLNSDVTLLNCKIS